MVIFGVLILIGGLFAAASAWNYRSSTKCLEESAKRLGRSEALQKETEVIKQLMGAELLQIRALRERAESVVLGKPPGSERN